MGLGKLPDFVRPLEQGESFCFECRPGITCFTDCCRRLDLELTPYDVLRIKKALGISSHEFFDRYAIIEQEETDLFPHVYLGMVDDGSASCPFVRKSGCTIYEHRPGACRMYPVGRGTFMDEEGNRQELYVLLTEHHCRGFSENRQFSIADWHADQGLESYNSFNDKVMTVLQHPRFKKGVRLSDSEREFFLLLLYRTDELRSQLIKGLLHPPEELQDTVTDYITADDEDLLDFAIGWLHHALSAA